MRDRDFEFWLANTYRTAKSEQLLPASVRSTLSDFRLVEKHEGDLDEHYRRDRMEGLLRRFEYTRDEEARHVKPRHSIPIRGCRYDGTATRKTAIQRYRESCTAAGR